VRLVVTALLAAPFVGAGVARSAAVLITLPGAAAAGGLIAILAAGARGRDAAGRLLVAVAAASAITTAIVLSTGRLGARSLPRQASEVEALLLVGLLVVAARATTAKGVAVVLTAGVAALAGVALRFETSDAAQIAVIGGATWAIAGTGIGLLFRAFDERRARSVRDAREAQRLRLAHDLHDFVAHDVSEILALAQAGQLLAADHPSCAECLAAIEGSALRALRSMDQTVHMLHDDIGANGHLHRLADLPELVARFSSANGVAVTYDLDGVSNDDLLRLAASADGTLYRVAVEALNNVRRHAPAAESVAICVRRVEGGPGDAHESAVQLSIVDDATPAPAAAIVGVARQSGLGLAMLATRVAELGGRLEAGPSPPAGWRVTATIPSSNAFGSGNDDRSRSELPS
jgi:signal transduction histidine kinase